MLLPQPVWKDNVREPWDSARMKTIDGKESRKTIDGKESRKWLSACCKFQADNSSNIAANNN